MPGMSRPAMAHLSYTEIRTESSGSPQRVGSAQRTTQMKRVMLGLALAVTLSCSTGCELMQKKANHHCQNGQCNGPLGCRPCRLGWQRGGTDYQKFLGHSGAYCNAHPSGYNGGPTGPTTAQVAYPYYTVRGPRDFLRDNPPSIGR